MSGNDKLKQILTLADCTHLHNMSTATKPPQSNNHEPQNPDTVDNKDDTDTDALLASLENEAEEDSAYRASRIEQLNAEFASAQATAPPAHLKSQSSTALNSHYDTAYPTLSTDQSVLDFTTQTHRCVVHFAHPDFARCGVMDEHLRALAARHYEVRFARVDVQNTPFVVEKLSIKVLPCVVGFCGGVGVERVVGFEGLGAGGKDGTDQFSSLVLEKRLLWKGVLVRERVGGGGREDRDEEDASESESEEDERKGRSGIRRGNARVNMDTEEDDDDWD